MFDLCSIIIPTFNQADFTSACLDSLALYSEGIGELIVVDNGSTDTTRELVRSFRNRVNFPVILEELEKNFGFSSACNLGAERSRLTNLLFLNNDTVVAENWLTPILTTLEETSVGCVAPRLLDPDGMRINHCGYTFNANLKSFYSLHNGVAASFPGANKRRNMQALLGACLGIKKKLFLEVGGFREYGLEDIDLCLRIKEKGLSNVYNPESTVFHHGSITVNRSKPDSLPKMNNEEFSKIWPSSRLVSDDHLFYLEDGYNVIVEDGAMTLECLIKILKNQIEVFSIP